MLKRTYQKKRANIKSCGKCFSIKERRRTPPVHPRRVFICLAGRVLLGNIIPEERYKAGKHRGSRRAGELCTRRSTADAGGRIGGGGEHLSGALPVPARQSLPWLPKRVPPSTGSDGGAGAGGSASAPSCPGASRGSPTGIPIPGSETLPESFPDYPTACLSPFTWRGWPLETLSPFSGNW